MDWTNLYKDTAGLWLKGNLHTHAGEGMSVAEIRGRYRQLGYDFLCISDHRKLTRPKAEKGNKLLLIPGFEWNSRTGEHMNLLSFRRPLLEEAVTTPDQMELLRRLAKQPVLAVLNHPNWQEPPHYTREQLFERHPVAGLEIYNGLIDRTAGTALATEKWDYLLSRNRLVLGFANDDAHQLSDIGQAWIMVRAATRSPQAVFSAIRKGNFYCSTGVTFSVIRRDGMRLEVRTRDADEIWAVGEWGARLARSFGRAMTFDFTDCRSPYVRFVAYGKGAAMAWTQPFLQRQPVDSRRISPFVASWKVSGLLPKPLAGVKPADWRNPALRWTTVPALARPEGFVNVSTVHGNADGIACLACRVTLAEAGRWTLSLGHDGGARLFVDGRRVIDKPLRVNPAPADRSQVRISLARGAHEIVVALDTDHGKGQGLFLRFIAPRGVKPGPAGLSFPAPPASTSGSRPQ